MWGSLPLLDIPADATVIFLRERAVLTTRAMEWLELAQNTVSKYYAAGGRQDIAAASIGCHGERGLSSWWAHKAGALNETCVFLPLRRPDDPWRFFCEWFGARRREWVSWPHIWEDQVALPTFWKARNRRKRDRRLTLFGAAVGRNHEFASDQYMLFEHWFSRFAANYSMRVLTAEGSLDVFGQQDNNALPGVNASESFTVSTRNGDLVSIGPIWYEPVDGEFGSGYFNALKGIVSRKPGMVSMTIVSSSFLELTRSWLCNVKSAGFTPPNIHWIALDAESRKELDASGVGHTLDISDALVGDNMDEVNILYGQPSYWKLMLLRTRLIRDLLDRGIDVFLFETDQVWLQNPFHYIKKELSAGADMVGTLDTQHNVAGNTILLRSVLPTKRMWSEVYLRFKTSYDLKEIESKEKNSSTFVYHDQYQLSDLLLFNPEFTKDFPVALALLNSQLFVGGSWYSGAYHTEEAKQPVVINNNFVSGTENKKMRAIAFGHWFLQRDNRTCNLDAIRKALQYKFPKLPGA